MCHRQACHGPLLPLLPQYLPALIECLDPTHLSVCNNASWAIGEITIKAGAEVRPDQQPTITHTHKAPASDDCPQQTEDCPPATSGLLRMD